MDGSAVCILREGSSEIQFLNYGPALELQLLMRSSHSQRNTPTASPDKQCLSFYLGTAELPFYYHKTNKLFSNYVNFSTARSFCFEIQDQLSQETLGGMNRMEAQL